MGEGLGPKGLTHLSLMRVHPLISEFVEQKCLLLQPTACICRCCNKLLVITSELVSALLLL